MRCPLAATVAGLRSTDGPRPDRDDRYRQRSGGDGQARANEEQLDEGEADGGRGSWSLREMVTIWTSPAGVPGGGTTRESNLRARGRDTDRTDAHRPAPVPTRSSRQGGVAVDTLDRANRPARWRASSPRRPPTLGQSSLAAARLISKRAATAPCAAGSRRRVDWILPTLVAIHIPARSATSISVIPRCGTSRIASATAGR